MGPTVSVGFGLQIFEKLFMAILFSEFLLEKYWEEVAK